MDVLNKIKKGRQLRDLAVPKVPTRMAIPIGRW